MRRFRLDQRPPALMAAADIVRNTPGTLVVQRGGSGFSRVRRFFDQANPPAEGSQV